MPNLPTKRVGPGGVQRVEQPADYEFIGEEHVHEPGQQVIVTISVETEPRETYHRQIMRIIATITMSVDFCVDMVPCFARINTYQVEAPHDERMEQQAKCDIKTGRALRSKDFMHHDTRLHFDRNKPFDVLINDEQGVLRWLGADFADAFVNEEQKQISGTSKLIP